ncbi:MAG: DUF3795 domain-containing protein [Candidatus Bathyarchaeota archaeon]|nr:DUF3795 domain-containing protein [Candidatus Bathyarchaeota archaeon]
MEPPFTLELIAPCGMNCGICKNYLAFSHGLPKGKGQPSHCSGCRPRNKNCAFIKRNCIKVAQQQVQFCYECQGMPCEKLSKLDSGYQKRYHMSMVENLKDIKNRGINAFLEAQQARYRCPNCGDVVSVHDRKCYACGKVAQL